MCIYTYIFAHKINRFTDIDNGVIFSKGALIWYINRSINVNKDFNPFP